MMRRLTILVAVMAALYSGYWFVGSAGVERAAKSGIASFEDEGWDISTTDVTTRGFPSRFDTTATHVRVYSSDGTIGIDAPFVQVLALSYRPNQVIGVLPEAFDARFAGQDWAVTNTKLRASVHVGAATSLPLETATAEATALQMQAADGVSLGADAVLAAIRSAGDTDGLPRYDVFLRADHVEVSARLARLFDPAARLPGVIPQIVVDATVTTDRPLDRASLPRPGQEPVKMRAIDAKNLQINWGAVTLTLTGDLTIDAAGTPTGALDLRAVNWQTALPLLVDLGIVPANRLILLQTMAANFTVADGSLAIPLTFADRQMAMGPIPLGPAPRF